MEKFEMACDAIRGIQTMTDEKQLIDAADEIHARMNGRERLLWVARLLMLAERAQQMTINSL